jgi:hypothetical protein
MSHVLQIIPVYLQWVSLAHGSSMRHGCNMNQKTDPLLNPLSIAMMLVFLRVELDPLVRRLGVDDPAVYRVVIAFFENLKRQYDRRIRARALRLRHHWRKADVPRLLQLPGWASPAVQRRIARLIEAKDKTGRGVISQPQTFAEAFFEVGNIAKGLSDPTTPADVRKNLYKKTPWFDRYVEAAYRGELRAWQRKEPYRKPSEHAREAVSDAVGISTAKVNQICDRERKQFTRGQFGKLDDPEMSAAELKRHLENGFFTDELIRNPLGTPLRSPPHELPKPRD